MKTNLLLIGILIAVLIFDVSAEVKMKKRRKIKPPKVHTEEPKEELSNEIINPVSQADELPDIEKEKLERDMMVKQMLLGFRQEQSEENEITDDPCSQVQCSAGMICETNKDGEAECKCIPECPPEIEERRKVCTNQNETFGSDCEVHRQRCLCLKKLDGCKGPEYSHVQVDYYGRCRNMPECTSEEINDFPRRMRDWLYYIMRDLADRHELSEYYLKLEKEVENNYTRGWINAAIWKWCDLDADDNDRFVSRHELFPIRAPLLALEHCIGPFLDSCDYDDDHRITLKEWGKCLELEESELVDRCEDLNEDL